MLLDDIEEACAFVAVFGGGIRPAFGGSGNVLNAHGQVKPIQHVMGRTEARRLAETPRSFAIAQNRHRRRRRVTWSRPRAKVRFLLASARIGLIQARCGSAA